MMRNDSPVSKVSLKLMKIQRPNLTSLEPQVVTSHITQTGTERHKGGSRNRPTASPSYHGRRGATRVKTPTASPGTAGQPHQVTQIHHIGPTPHHTGNRLDSHQCQRGTGYQSHHGHGAHTRLTIVTDTGRPPMPLFACRFHPQCFPSVPFGFPRGPSLRRCNSVLIFSAHHLEDGRDGDLIGLAVPEECRGFPFTYCLDDAFWRAGCRKRGGPSSPERLHCLHPCGPTASACGGQP